MDQYDLSSNTNFCQEEDLVGDFDYNLLPDMIFTSDLDQHGLEQTVNSGNIPSRLDFPGECNFSFTIDETMSGQQWVYSEVLQQLFIGMNKIIVMQFRMNREWANHNSKLYIMAMPVYSTDEHINLPVNRCILHSVEDDPQGHAHQQEEKCFCGPQNNYVGHVLRGDDNAQHLFDLKSKRHYVRVLVTPPQAGCDHIAVPYSFACKTSCTKGMQRRPIHVIFTLQDEIGNVFGRQKICVKISSCPKRDKKRQEQDECEKRGVKRKHSMPEDISIDSFFNPVTNIKVENVEPRYHQKSEITDELKREIFDARKLFDGIKEMVSKLEFKMKRIGDLMNDRL